MWRFFKTVPRAIRQQWNTSVRSAPQSVHCEEDQNGIINRSSLVSQSYFPGYQQRWQFGLHQESADRKQSGRAQNHSRWTTPNCQHGFLEAVGWGTAILLGLQLSKLYHLRSSQEKRQNCQEDDSCPLQWLRRLAVASKALPSTSSYISAKQQNPDCTEPFHFDEEGNTQGGLLGDGQEGLDYESLLDIEVRSLHCDCKLHYESSDQFSERFQHDVLNANDHSHSHGDTKDQQGVTSSDNAEGRLKEAVDEWCALSDKCTAMVHQQIALHYLRKGNTQEAFKQWQQACQQGDSRACFNLALCYELGKGTAVDLSKAVEHYEIAAAGGHHAAMYNLAMYYLDGRGGLEKDVTMALILLEKAASEGMSQAQTELGVLLSEECGDWHQSTELFSSAAQKDDISAKYFLGVCYENGWGVACDTERAVEFYTAAASAGHPSALHSLAFFKEKGRGGMPVDRKAACELYKKAVQAGNQVSDKEHRRLIAELNQERFDSERHTIQKNDGKPCLDSRRSQSSPSLVHTSLSFYIRENLLDFGLDDLHPTHPRTPHGDQPAVKVTFQVGDVDSGERPPELECASHTTGTSLGIDPAFKLHGGFGDVRVNKVPKKLKLKGTFGNFNPKSQGETFPSQMGFEHQTEMRVVLCS